MSQQIPAIDNFPLTKRQLLIVANIFFWFTFIMFDAISTAGIINGYLSFTFFRAIIHALIFAAFMVYPNLYILYPKYFSKAKYLPYTLFALGIVVLTFYIRTSIDQAFTDVEWAKGVLDSVSPGFFNQESADLAIESIQRGGFLSEISTEGGATIYQFEFAYYLGMVIGCIGVFFITTPIKLVEDWYEKQQLKFQVLEDRLKLNETKLKFLKAQTDPHFLINSLSGVYHLALLQSDQIDHAILRLSELMSYLLGYGQQEKIALKHEMSFIENFINFHQAISLENLNIEFKHNASNAQLESVEIPPMLIQPFFENALKHGDVEDNPGGWIKSEMRLNDHQLIFTIENTIDTKRARKYKAKSHHVGLQNVRERLEMAFAEKYSLNTSESEGRYRVELKLLLDDAEIR